MNLLFILLTIITLIATPSGVSDKSFNQSAWDGISDIEGAGYLDTQSDSDYITAYGAAITGGTDILIANGFNQVEAVEEFRENNQDQQLITVDFVRDEPNTISITFDDEEAAYLAGVVAANETETGKVGFIGGGRNEITENFERGYRHGVEQVEGVEVEVEFIGDFTDSAKAKQIAQAMYANGVDIIYTVAGNAGMGVFSEAKDIVKNDPEQRVFVIGVDMDQDEEGQLDIDGQTRYLTLASTLKQIGVALRTELENYEQEGFQDGHRVYGIKEQGVGITTERLSEETRQLVEQEMQ